MSRSLTNVFFKIPASPLRPPDCARLQVGTALRFPRGGNNKRVVCPRCRCHSTRSPAHLLRHNGDMRLVWLFPLARRNVRQRARISLCRWEVGAGSGMAGCQHVPAATGPRRVPLGKDKEPQGQNIKTRLTNTA